MAYIALPDVEVYLLAESSLDPVWSNSLKTSVPILTENNGVYVTPTHTLATAPPLDVLIVPGGPGSFDLLTGGLGAEVAFINATYPSLQFLFSVCTGNALSAASVRYKSRMYSSGGSSNTISLGRS